MQKRDYISNKALFDLSGRVAIVTGAAGGIGFSISHRLAEAGAAILIADINSNKGEQAVKELIGKGYKAAFAGVDVSRRTDIKNTVGRASKTFGGLDIMVNNVGMYPIKPFLEVDETYWQRVIDTNLKATFFGCLEAANQMIRQRRGGVIINVSSQSAFYPTIGLSVYDTAKAGIIMLTRNLAKDLAQYGIRVNALCPGATVTPGQEANINLLEQHFVPRIPLGRLANPDDIASVALFLASDAANYVTGTYVLADGGFALS